MILVRAFEYFERKGHTLMLTATRHRFRWPMVAFALLVTILLLPRATAAEPLFTHPGGAYGLTPPDGWKGHAFVNELGFPYHVYTPDAGEDPARYARGLWVFAVPIPSDEELNAKHIAGLVSILLTAREPGLKVALEDRKEVKLGTLPGAAMTVAGKRSRTIPWLGELRVAVQEDNFLVVHYGGPPAEWKSLQEKCAVALKDLVAPLKPASRGRPGRLKQKEEAPDVANYSMLASLSCEPSSGVP
jgi:hypothetical protein